MNDQLFRLLAGDCRDRLAELDDDSVDAIVTDPPYELGFMGKRWDASGIAYDVAMWSECLRVVKPGGYLLAFGGTRTYHRMVCAIEDAGFDIRDSLHWVYGSGFPKSLDVAKAIDKTAGIWRGRAGDVQSPNGSMNSGNYERTDKGDPVTVAAVEWEGWGTALKPAHEPIVVARKPFVGTVADNVQMWGTGALNIDGCRIATTDQVSVSGETAMLGGTGPGWDRPCKSDPEWIAARRERAEAAIAKANELGRWPANVLMTHTAECRNVDPETDVPVFECAPGCPVPILDQQSGTAAGGVSSSGTGSGGISGRGTVYTGEPVGPCYGDAVGASRFFAASEWSPEFDVPFIYTAKPSRAERNAGLNHLPDKPSPKFDGGTFVAIDGSDRTATQARNYHPTVKPVALMRYLVRLVTRRGGTILDPFAGSGTTMVAAILEERFPIGIELTGEYDLIILGRCEHAARNLQLALF